MGGAAVAITHDGTAPWYNPAGLGRVTDEGSRLPQRVRVADRTNQGFVDGLDLAGTKTAIFPGSVGYVKPLGVFGNGIHHAVGLAWWYLTSPSRGGARRTIRGLRVPHPRAFARTDPVDRPRLGRLLWSSAMRGRLFASGLLELHRVVFVLRAGTADVLPTGADSTVEQNDSRRSKRGCRSASSTGQAIALGSASACDRR